MELQLQPQTHDGTSTLT